ncbi:MAG TPA: flagellar hook protein FlgE [Steroidobacteraceae bacterium]|jgi:flagellar hook protein FlgE|nr:flagellar hook protein FlgE [Steroidobacteraceae bacterium]
MASFSIALSGLTAASSDLDVTANNVANADTVGFKESRAEFADVFAAGAVNLNTSAVGEGVRLSTTAQQFTQGNISTSGSNLDLAISGDGFFTLQDPSNGIVYTRNGQFSEDKNGNVVTATGQALQVYPPTTTGGFNTGALTDLNLQTAQSSPLATSAGTVILNLPAGSTPPTGGAFDPTNPATYNQSTSTTVYDSLGNSFPATFFFTQTATPGLWNVNMTVNGVLNATTNPLQFSSTGAVTPPASGALDFPGFAPTDGAAPMDMNFNFAQSTQFGGDFGVTSIIQNGFATGQLSTVSIDPTGVVSAVYTNGRSTQLGQLALANFPDPQGLKQLGDTNWAETFSSGTHISGTAGTAGFGSVQSGALEASNVDLTTELVNMITAQRAFQANAQVITTANQLSETVINITH